MSLIGEMHYLTIGDKTYSVAASITIDNAISPAIAGSAVTGTSTIYNSTNVPSSSAVVDYVEGRGFISGDVVRSVNGQTGDVTISGPTKLSQLTNDVGYITSYTDEKLKWTLTTSSNLYYPLISTATAATSTANASSGISFYQYYTSGGYRQLRLGNGTNYTSNGGAYGSIRLYGTGSYYGDLNPGTIGANSLTDFRTWTLPDKTGTIALTSDIPTVPTNVSSFTNDAGYTTNTGTVTSITVSNATNGGLSISGSPISTSGTVTIGHSNVLTSAQTTSAVYPIKIDKNGHISDYGNAVTVVNTRGTATNGGTTLSVVNTGDMYIWDNKTQAQIVRW